MAEKTSDSRSGAKKASKDSNDSQKRSAPRASAPKRPGAGKVASEAVRQLLELTGREAEGVTGLQRTDDGWTVHVEVVELHRIPDTTDLLALYEVETDSSGDLQGYRRLRRYARGDSREE